MAIESEETLIVPPAKVFAALSDFEKTVNWMPGVVVAKVSTTGPVGVGTQFRQERTVMKNKRDVVDVAVLTHVPPTTLVLDVKRNGKQTAVVTWVVTPTSAGSHVKCSMDLKMGAAIAFLWGGMIRKQIAGDIAGLKTYLEKGAV